MNTFDLVLLILFKLVIAMVLSFGLIIFILGTANRTWKLMCDTVAWPIFKRAIKEYRQNHPEEFKVIDAMRIKVYADEEQP